jgi:hypothetical protein
LQGSPQQTALTWTYTFSGCSSDPNDFLTIIINRGWLSGPSTGLPQQTSAVGTMVTVSYPYHWRFNSVIQLLFPGPSSYASFLTLTESAIVHNQM